MRVASCLWIAAATVPCALSALLHPSSILCPSSTALYHGARAIASPLGVGFRRAQQVRPSCSTNQPVGSKTNIASSTSSGGEDAGGDDVEVLLDVPMPKYDDRAVARDVFTSSLYFYHGSERLRQHFAAKTEALGGITIGALRRKCYRDGKLVEDVLGETYGVLKTFEFFASGDVATLARQEYVALNAHHEVDAYRDFRRRHGRDLNRRRLPAFWDVYHCGFNQPHDYTSPVCYVLGPHKSGKTFFALDFLRGFRNGGLPEVVLYVQPAENPDLTSPTMEKGWEKRYARRLVEWIKHGLEEELQRKLYMRLPMFVCIVLDNAGDHRLNGALMHRDAARTLRRIAEQSIAERVVVVVAGTGLITDSIPEGRGGAYHFRMQPLQRDDLKRLIGNRFYEEGDMWNKIEGRIPSKDPQKEALAIADAIEAHPALMAVAQNTEMAFTLVEAIVSTILLPEARYAGPHLAEYWSAQRGPSSRRS
jgi:hypothetical protein